MKTKLFAVLALTFVCALNTQLSTARAQNIVITYQGQVRDNGSNFTGTGQFQFALVTSTNNNHTATATANLFAPFITSYNVTAGGNGYVTSPLVTITGGGGTNATVTANLTGGVVTSLTPGSAGTDYTSVPTVTIAPPPANITYTTYWSNDGTSINGSEPAAMVTIGVTNGFFTVVLGDTTQPNMAAISAALFIQPGLQLRVWFNDGANGFALLDPAQNLTSVPYAAFANTAGSVNGIINAAQIPGVVTNNEPSVTLGSLNLPARAAINSGGSTILYSDSNGNFFNGANAGNADHDFGGNNTASGVNALAGNLSGNNNVAVGNDALNSNATGFNNVATGTGALQHNTASYNTAAGGFALQANTTGNNNVAVGYNALNRNTTGDNNVATGTGALQHNTASDNTAGGGFALQANTTGNNNVAVGYNALNRNTTGYNNVAAGTGALQHNTASDNTAGGDFALQANTTGNWNTANGYNALNANQTGSYNLADGAQALYRTTTGNFNTAVGDDAMKLNITGGSDVAVGYQGLENGTNLNYSTAVGYQSLKNSTTVVESSAGVVQTLGDYNTALGYQSLLHTTTGSSNVAVGYQALLNNTTGYGNIAIGPGAGSAVTTGYGNIDIGNSGLPTDENVIRIGEGGTTCVLGSTYVYMTEAYANNLSVKYGLEVRDVTVTGGLLVDGYEVNGNVSKKENLSPVDSQTVLAKVASLPMSEWNDKKDSQGVRHIGPTAQDFQAAFQLSTDDKHISLVDMSGVTIAAIQGLNQKMNEKDAEIKNLEKQLNQLQALVKQLANQK